MSELISDSVVSQIFKLNLTMRLIADNKTVFPFILKNRSSANTYTIMLDSGNKDLWQYHKWVIELKGRVDIEYLKYRGEVQLEAIHNEPGYYKMSQIKLYKDNQRAHKRVPYRRDIKIISPVQMEGVLIDLSASGARFECSEKIQGEFLCMTFILLKKNIVLDARIIEQTYNKESERYIIRCHFDSINKKTEKIISQAVKEITLMAKRRLQG